MKIVLTIEDGPSGATTCKALVTSSKDPSKGATKAERESSQAWRLFGDIMGLMNDDGSRQVTRASVNGKEVDLG